jgi:serine/threonine protein phosphatase PrpC
VLKAWGVSDKGPARKTNQDRFAIDEAHHVCVVADGVGGHNAGDVAARVAVEALLDVIRNSTHLGWPLGVDPSLSESGNLIRTAIHLANLRVIEMASGSNELAGMGTTIVVALVQDGRLTVGHVGDSRLYRLSRGRLRQLTGDDSWTSSIAFGTSAEELRHHPMRHVLTNVVGGRRLAMVHVVEEPLEPGDRLLLTTDGVHGALRERQIERLVESRRDGAAVAAAIVEAALGQGSRDNCTAVLAQYAA